MAAEELHVGDIGTKLVITVLDDGVPVNVSTASGFDTWTFIFCKPDFTTATGVGSLHTDGSDGKVSYIIPSGLLDVEGDWKYQVKVETTGTHEWYSDTGTLPVHCNLI